MKRNKIIYVSGKYSGTPKQIEENIQVAKEYAVKIWEAGFTALCPHLNTCHFEKETNKVEYQDYIDGDLALLSKCDAIFMLPNWGASKGAIVERFFAEKHVIPVYYDLEKLVQEAKHL